MNDTFFLVGGVALVLGCAVGAGPSPQSSTVGALLCVPAARRACLCDGGGHGFQVCNSAGTEFDACHGCFAASSGQPASSAVTAASSRPTSTGTDSLGNGASSSSPPTSNAASSASLETGVSSSASSTSRASSSAASFWPSSLGAGSSSGASPASSQPSSSSAGVDPIVGEWPRWPLPPAHPTNYTYDANTVTDALTGLVWQRGVSTATYNWSQGKDYCTTLALAGGAWRLPTATELRSLVDYTTFNPAINQDAFPATPSGYFWSATPYLNGSNLAWLESFYDGFTSGYYVDAACSVRCVR